MEEHHMRVVGGIVIGLVFLGTAGCASRNDLQMLERDTSDARKRIVRLEREMEGIRQTANDEVQGSLKGFRKELDTIRKGSADLQASQDTIRVDMQALSGSVDDLKILVQKRTDEKKFLGEEADRRLAALETRLANLEKHLEGLKAAGSAPAQATPESVYQNALTIFKSGDMPKARSEFSRAIELNPRHEQVASAQYWIGETYYAEKNYDQAILAFQEVITKHPKKEKAPAALLKQALSFKELKDVKSARYLLRKLQEDYPRSDEAKRVPALLKTLQ
jgi:tol-pal system protein YbgF